MTYQLANEAPTTLQKASKHIHSSKMLKAPRISVEVVETLRMARKRADSGAMVVMGRHWKGAQRQLTEMLRYVDHVHELSYGTPSHGVGFEIHYFSTSPLLSDCAKCCRPKDAISRRAGNTRRWLGIPTSFRSSKLSREKATKPDILCFNFHSAVRWFLGPKFENEGRGIRTCWHFAPFPPSPDHTQTRHSTRTLKHNNTTFFFL